MNSQKYLIRNNLVVILLLSTFSHTPMAQDNGLEVTLNAKEQALLNSYEQKKQAESLIKLMDSLQKLSGYPTEAINELTSNDPNHQLIHRVVKHLKQAKDKSINTMEPLNFGSQANNKTDSDNHRNSQLIPVFATASSDNGITAGKVIFKNTAGVSIPALEGQPFIYNGKPYKLLSVSPVAGNKGQFSIQLKTPTSTQQYIWPR
ncbi:MAG: hypothetical protein P8J25_01080 [Porticoccaceae bacterium]|nr:hypothetical protein [Porticoccaceae bacterium]